MAKGKLLAGASKKSITPTQEEVTSYVGFCGPYDGTYGEVYVRTIVLGNEEDKVVLSTPELVSTPCYSYVLKRISEKYGIKESNILLGGTQNHLALTPNIKTDPDSNSDDPSVRMMGRIVDAIIDSVGEAIEKMVPARMGYGCGYSNINTNRDWTTPSGVMQNTNFAGYSDKDLPVLKIETLDGKPIACYVNYGMQGTVLLGAYKYTREFPKFNSDIMGAISNFVEKAVGGDYICQWTVGGAGDQNAMLFTYLMEPEMDDEGKFSRVFGANYTLSAETGFHIINYLAGTQGLDILETMRKIHFYTDEFEVRSGFATAEVPECERWQGVYGQWVSPEPGEDYERVLTGNTVKYNLQLVVINEDIAFAGANAIVGSMLAKEVKDMLPYNTFFLGVIDGFTSYATDPSSVPYGFAKMATRTIPSDTERAFINGFHNLAKTID